GRAIAQDGIVALGPLPLAAGVGPANAILLPWGGLLWLARWQAVTHGDVRRLVGGALLVGALAMLPIVPQVLLNWEVYGQLSPLSVRSLYAEQVTKGVHYLKYASFALHEHGGEPAGFY